jgi:hypothetical protein
MFFYNAVQAQMKRERVQTDRTERAIFKAPTVVLLNSVKNLYKNTLYMTIYHTFGSVNTGINELFGLDVSANIRLGLDYGITDRFSIGIGRTRYNKSIDGRFKYTLLSQTHNNSNPVQIAMAGDISLNTQKKAFPGPYKFSDKLGLMYMFMLARKFSNELSIQIAPSYVHFNKVLPGEQNNFWSFGMSGRYKLTDHTSLAIEYVPVLNKPGNIKNTVSIGLNIETGSHVFQIFLSNSEYYTPQDVIRYTKDNFWAGDIHFGFNVSRIFTFGAKGLHY